MDTLASGKLIWMCSGITGTDQDSPICPGHSMTTKSGIRECGNLHFTLAKNPRSLCLFFGVFLCWYCSGIIMEGDVWGKC